MRINKNALKYHRILKNYGQEDLALAAGLSKDTISAIERGKQKNSQKNTLKSLATALEIPENKLLLPPPSYLIDEKFVQENAKYVDENIERISETLYSNGSDRYYFFVSGLKIDYFESLPEACLYVVDQVRDLIFSHDDMPIFFKADSDAIVSTTASILHFMKKNLVLKKDLYTEKHITDLLHNGSKLHLHENSEQLRLSNLLATIRDSRFEDNHVRLVQLLNLYLFISESWINIEDKENAYDMLCIICRVLDGKEIDKNDIEDIYCASELFATAIFPLEKYCMDLLTVDNDCVYTDI